MQVIQRILKIGNDSNYRTVPKYRSWGLLPMPARWIQNRFVPVESLLNTAIRPSLRRSSSCSVLQLRRDNMLGVPKLAHSAVCNSSERAATRWSPIRCEDRFPYHEHAHLSVGVSRQQLLSCGGPPQTGWSSWRQQQDQAWNVGVGIERLLELRRISFRECDNRLLAAWRGAGTPQIRSRQPGEA